jgi:signal transduction histidine kinase
VLEKGPDCSIEGDNLQIFRSVQNIVNNAIDALPAQNGCVTVTWTVQDGMVAIAVRDNGCGIPADKINDLQKKHFTTKKESGGMGLGLFITKNIAEAHGGSLTLANNETPPGACVTLTFPLLD